MLSPQIANLVRQKIGQFNVMMGSQLQQGQTPGRAEGGSAPGIIPGPVSMMGGDNTMTPTKSGEYILPVEAVMGLGVRMGATTHGDALAIGKHILDKEVMGLKKEMGNNTPPRNAGIPAGTDQASPTPGQGVGFAEGGIISDATQWVGSHIVDPLKNMMTPKPGIPVSSTPPLQPTQVGTGYLNRTGTAVQGHNTAVEQVARDTGYAEGGYIDSAGNWIKHHVVDPVKSALTPKPGIPAPVTPPPQSVGTGYVQQMGIKPTQTYNQKFNQAAREAEGYAEGGMTEEQNKPVYSPIKDINLGAEGLSENVGRNKAIQQAIGGQGYTNLIPPDMQPNLQQTPGIPAGQSGIGGGKVTMTPTTDKLATDKEGYLKSPQGVSPGTGIIKTDGKTFDVSGMGPSQQTNIGKPLPVNPFTTFYKSLKAEGKSDAEISTAWNKNQEDVMKNRIPEYVAEGFDSEGNPLAFSRRTGNVKKGEAPEGAAKSILDWQATKKAVATSNSPQIKRMVAAGESLFTGTKDKSGKQLIEPTMDKVVRLRNEIPDGAFGSISDKLMKFNTWDQWVGWQTSDPKVAEFKSTLIATAERMALIYQGGLGATSDQKIKMAQDLLRAGLSKEAFSTIVNSHKNDLMNTVNSYAAVRPNVVGEGPKYGPATAQPAQGGVWKQPGTNSVPMDAVNELKQNPTPQMQKHFDDIFGPGYAERVLKS